MKKIYSLFLFLFIAGLVVYPLVTHAAVFTGSSAKVIGVPEPSLSGLHDSTFASVTDGNGSSSVELGDNLVVHWWGSSVVRLVNVYISYDGGQTYAFLEGPILNTDTYSWPVPNDVDFETVKFKIEGTDLAEILAEVETEEINIGMNEVDVAEQDESVQEDEIWVEDSEENDQIIEDQFDALLDGFEDVFDGLFDGLFDLLDDALEELAGQLVPNFEQDLTVGSTGEDVMLLQMFLNSRGYTVAESGPGSEGSETEYFGELTRQALAQYQRDAGLPAYGYFGPLTREYIAESGIVITDEGAEINLDELFIE